MKRLARDYEYVLEGCADAISDQELRRRMPELYSGARQERRGSRLRQIRRHGHLHARLRHDGKKSRADGSVSQSKWRGKPIGD